LRHLRGLSVRREKDLNAENRIKELEAEVARLRETVDELDRAYYRIAPFIDNALSETLPDELDRMWGRLGPTWMRRVVDTLYERFTVRARTGWRRTPSLEGSGSPR